MIRRFHITVYVLVFGWSLFSCGKEPLEVPKPNINIKVDWEKHLFKDEEPVDESAYPPCDELPMMFNPAHPDNYESRYTGDTIYSGLTFQQGTDPLYAVYVRHVPDEKDLKGVFNLIGQVVLLDLRNGDTTTLGWTNARPSIGGSHVVFPSGNQFIRYDILTSKSEINNGEISSAKVSANGGYMFFYSHSAWRDFKARTSYIVDLRNYRLIHEVHPDDMIDVDWIDSSRLVFNSFLDENLYIYDVTLSKSSVFKGPFRGHFRLFSGISEDLTYAYGRETYAINLESHQEVRFHEDYIEDGCETIGYQYIHPLPNGQLLVEKYYRPIDTVSQIVYFQQELRLFDADGTNERMVTLLLK